MLFYSGLRNATHSAPGARRPRHTAARQQAGYRPRPEALEDRCLLSCYQQTDLVGFKPGVAHFTDSNLNGWGMASMPDGSFVVANTFATGLATLYNNSGHVLLPQTITIPGSASPAIDQTRFGIGSVGHPTGVVYNPTKDFVISENGKSAPALLIFDTIDGTISGWNPKVDPTNAILMVDNGAAGDAYTGLAMARNSQGQNVSLYSGRFHSEPRGDVECKRLEGRRLLHRSDCDERRAKLCALVSASG